MEISQQKAVGVVGEVVFCFFYEGPRSRCYRSTAALRLIVQHCDEDD
jgi:hypothetical protein